MISALVGGVQSPILGGALGALGVHLVTAGLWPDGAASPLSVGLGLLVVVYVLPDGISGWIVTLPSLRRWIRVREVA